jgi:hypothetical protein
MIINAGRGAQGQMSHKGVENPLTSTVCVASGRGIFLPIFEEQQVEIKRKHAASVSWTTG